MPCGWKPDRRGINEKSGRHRGAAAAREANLKISIIGGAGVRVPLLVRGLVRSDLRISEVALFDPDQPRLRIIADLAKRAVPEVLVEPHSNADSCIEGSDFVITSIRVGGSGQRARDEALAISHDVVGQETVGAAGFAMALRAIPPMVEYGRLTAKLAPRAWLVNFTNPVSAVTQAVHQETDARIIGICDTPFEICEDAAHALGLSPHACAYDYFGLNHLGWLREVYDRGVPQLHRLWDDEAGLRSAYRDPLFEPERLRSLRLLPTEYLYYYYRPEVALDHLRRAGTSRGGVVAQLTDRLFADLVKGVQDPLARYERYLAARDASYMQVETGSTAPRVKPAWAELSGYDRIALMTMRGIVHDTKDVIPLDVANHANFPFLAAEDIVEVPSVVDRNGPRALHVAPIPDHCASLISRVKSYERATVAAALSGSRDDRLQALQLNPLAGRREGQSALLDALIPA
jgi:6-phospho-beta-glucosidase